MTGLIEKWWSLHTFTQSSIHNVVLVFVYAGFIWQFYRGFKGLMSSKKGRVKAGRVLRSFMGLLLIYFLLSSLILFLIQPKFLIIWRFNGWLNSDIALLVVYLVLAVTAFFFLSRGQRYLWLFGLILLAEFVIGSYVLIIINIAGVTFTSTSPLVTTSETQSMLVNKVEKAIPNSTGGISTSITSFLLSSIDLESGKKIWHRHSSWWEYLIGDTPNGLFVVNTKKEAVYFLDQKTGKQKMNEEEWTKTIPELAGKLSYAYTDYYILKELLYFYGLDGKYYKVDFKTKQVSTITQDEFKQLSARSDEDDIREWQLQNQIAALYPELLNITLNTQLNDQTALVTYQTKRNAEDVELALVSLAKPKLFWQVTLTPSEEADFSEEAVFLEKNNVYALFGKYVYKIHAETGKVVYTYNYQTNQVK